MSTMRELTAVAKALAEVVKSHVATAFSSLAERVSKVEKQQESISIPDADEIAQRVRETIPAPVDGKDGKDADPEKIKEMVLAAVAEIPKPRDGEPGKSVGVDDVKPLLEELVARAFSELPKPKDGESVSHETIDDMVNTAVAKAMNALPKPADGNPGRDALEIEILPAIDLEKSYPRGVFATHKGGLFRSYQTTVGIKGWECLVDGIADITIEQSHERGISVVVTRSSEQTTVKTFDLPAMIYRGVFKPGEYKKGDCVTWGGNLWHCEETTSEKPGEVNGKGWTLCVKKGRDGKDGRNGIDKTKPVNIQ